MKPGLSQRLAALITLLAIAAAAWSWAGRQLLAMRAHQLQWAQDLAFFNQIFHAASEGRAWTSPLLLEPTGFFSMVHFHPIFGLLVPIYALAPGAETLLVFNAVGVALAAWPLYRLGASASGRPLFGSAAAIAFLAWLPVCAAACSDFRPMNLLIPGLAWICWGIWGQRRGALALGALIACGAREEASYLLVACGLAGALLPWSLVPAAPPDAGRWRVRWGLACAAIGLAWFGSLLMIKENFFYHFDPRVFLEGLTSSEPGPEIPTELIEARRRYLLQSALGGYLLAPLAPAPLAMSGGPLAQLLTDTHREWHAMTGTYVYIRSSLLPLIAAAGTVGAGAVVRRWPRAAWALGSLMILGNALGFPDEREAYRNRDAWLSEQASEAAPLDALLARVPPEARVATDYRLIAALSGREVLWNVSHMYLEDPVPPWWGEPWPLTLEEVDTLVAPDGDPMLARAEAAGWTERARGGGYQLWGLE